MPQRKSVKSEVSHISVITEQKLNNIGNGYGCEGGGDFLSVAKIFNMFQFIDLKGIY